MGILETRISDWEANYRKSLIARPEVKKEFKNQSGITLKPLYVPDDVDDDYLAKLGVPGEYPYTRGIYPGMYRTSQWSRRMLLGFEGPEVFNRRQKDLIRAGQTGLNIAPDNPFFRGLDVDQVDRELVGTTGVPINALVDMEIALEGIQLDKISLGLNDSGPFTWPAMVFALAEKQGVPLTEIHGTTNQSDFISHYVALHMYIRVGLEGHLRLLVDHVKYCTEKVPGWNPLSIVGQHMQQAGATPAQTLAFTLSSAIFYVNQCIKAGLNVDEFAKRFSFFFDTSINLFEEVAKFRAGRRMWAKILKDRFKSKDSKTQLFKFHAQTSGTELTRQQPLNNIARVCIQALGAILGGTQSLHTDAYDEALQSPSEEAALIALQTQHIIANESGVADVIDPLGGSYYVESLTDEMEKKAWDYINKIDAMGGMLEAIKSGYIQNEIGIASYNNQRMIEKKERVVVGLNKFQINEKLDTRPIHHKPDLTQVEKHVNRIKSLRKNRNQAKAQDALHYFEEAAKNPSLNLFEAVVNGVKADLTHGEIISKLRDIYGFGRPIVVE